MLPNLLKLIKFEVIVHKDELHKILDYFSSAIIPFNHPNFELTRKTGTLTLVNPTSGGEDKLAPNSRSHGPYGHLD